VSPATIADRSLYLCTPDRPDLIPFVAACVAGGVDIVQLREKHLEAREILRVGAALGRCCRDLGVPFIMNDRPDLALELDADGVHVGQDDAPPALARRILGPDRIVGLSTHAPAEATAGVLEPVDYLAAGPVVHTATHPDRVPTGVGYIADATRATERRAPEGRPLPLFITGGVTPSAIPGLWAAGARRFVVVRYLTEAPDPRAAAQELRRAIDIAEEAPEHG
jgi:thiamine-phosphate pyrophosphorylase